MLDIWQPYLLVYGYVYHLFELTAFIWAPILLVYIAVKVWLEYVRADFVSKFKWVLIEIKLPRTIDKTPLAMELVLQSMYQASTGNWYKRWWTGKVKPCFSLEIISHEGDVHFFIRTPDSYKRVIESTIYAQYPDIEVHEVEDYIHVAPYLKEPGEWDLWGSEFKLSKADPYPIRTYVDFGLDSTSTKEEQKTDPITSFIEFMGSLGRNQELWFQVIIQATSPRFRTPGTWLGRHDWKDEGKTIVKELQEKWAGETGMRATKHQQEIISAIERSFGKIAFDCGIRAVYLCKKEAFDASNIGGILGSLRQYGAQDLNSFKPSIMTDIDYPWQDWDDKRLNKKKRRIFDAYVRRSWFYRPYQRTPFVLNTEELATIYHFPGGVSETPTFSRIDSRKGEPPANLPV
jgi:hypothetical protein